MACQHPFVQDRRCTTCGSPVAMLLSDARPAADAREVDPETMRLANVSLRCLVNGQAKDIELLRQRLADEVARRETVERERDEISEESNLYQQSIKRHEAATEPLRAALAAIIHASDQCRGHRECGHSMEPWQRARTLLAAEPQGDGG